MNVMLGRRRQFSISKEMGGTLTGHLAGSSIAMVETLASKTFKTTKVLGLRSSLFLTLFVAQGLIF